MGGEGWSSELVLPFWLEKTREKRNKENEKRSVQVKLFYHEISSKHHILWLSRDRGCSSSFFTAHWRRKRSRYP